MSPHFWFEFAVNMAVLIHNHNSLTENDLKELKRPIVCTNGAPRKRKLILSNEDDEEDNARTSMEVNLCQDTEKSGGITTKRPRSVRSYKQIIEYKVPSAEEVDKGRKKLINLVPSVTKRKNFSKRSKKGLDGRGLCKRRLSFSKEEKGCVFMQNSEGEEDKEYSPGSSSTTRSLIGRQKISLHSEVIKDKRSPENCCNDAEKKEVCGNECWINKGICEGKKVRKPDGGRNKAIDRTLTQTRDEIQHSHEGRTSNKKNSDKNCEASKNKEISIPKTSTHGKWDDSDEDWDKSSKRQRPSAVAADVQRIKTIENSERRRVSERRRCTSNKKYSFENFVIGDWIDDEEDIVLCYEESTVDSDSNNMTRNGSYRLSSAQPKGKIKDRTEEDDDCKIISINSSSSSSSSSVEPASKSDRKSTDRSTNRKTNVNLFF